MGHTEVVTSVAFSPDGSTIAMGSWDKTVHLWSPKGEAICTLAFLKTTTMGHIEVVSSVDGSTITTGSRDKTVRLWSLKGEAICTLAFPKTMMMGHTEVVTSVAFSPDGMKQNGACVEPPRVRLSALLHS